VLFALGQPYQQVFVPLLAVDVLQVGRSGVGLMLAITGLGALAGSLIVASKGSLPHRSLIMMGALTVFSLSLVLLSLSASLIPAFIRLFLAGTASVTYMALNSSLLFEQAPPEFHGRVMSLMTMDRGVMPVGAILGGALAHAFGPQTGLTLMGVFCLAATAMVFLFVPALRKLA
jgi:predicted MFS family arabinose efflux permease